MSECIDGSLDGREAPRASHLPHEGLGDTIDLNCDNILLMVGWGLPGRDVSCLQGGSEL